MKSLITSALVLVILCTACISNNNNNNEKTEVMISKKELRITLAQIKHGNWDFKEQMIYTMEALKSIKPNSTDLIILPEMCPGKLGQIPEFAKSLNTFIVAGVSERIEGNTFANKSVVINNKGEIVTTYTKMFLHREEQNSGYIEGNTTKTFEIGNIKIGVLICGDLGLGVEAVLDLYHKNVDLIVIPASAYSNSLEYWKWHTVIKSLDTGIPICMVNYAGIYSGEKYSSGGGHSLIVAPLPKGQENKDLDSLLQSTKLNPAGHVLFELGDNPEIFSADIDLSVYNNFRNKLKPHRDKGLSILKNSIDEPNN